MNPLSDWDGKYVKITVNEVNEGKVVGWDDSFLCLEDPSSNTTWVDLEEWWEDSFKREWTISESSPPMKNGYWQIFDTESVFQYRDGEWFYLSGDPLTYTPDTSNGVKYLGDGE